VKRGSGGLERAASPRPSGRRGHGGGIGTTRSPKPRFREKVWRSRAAAEPAANPLVERVVDLASGLSDEERADVVAKLLGPRAAAERAALERAWEDEIRRRMEDFDKGEEGTPPRDIRALLTKAGQLGGARKLRIHPMAVIEARAAGAEEDTWAGAQPELVMLVDRVAASPVSFPAHARIKGLRSAWMLRSGAWIYSVERDVVRVLAFIRAGTRPRVAPR